MKKVRSLSVVFPAYNDEHTISILVQKAVKLLPQIAGSHEIIIVDDGSTDKTAQVLKQLQKKTKKVKVITHLRNQGYGAALISGFKKAKKEFIFYTDGDGQYDISELPKLVNAMDTTIDIVSGFKIKRSDPWFRKTIGGLYNQFTKFLLNLTIKDVDCDFRLFRRSLIDGLKPLAKSGAFDVSFIKALSKKGARFREIGVHHYKRRYGSSQFFNAKRIGRSLWDLVLIWFTYAK